MMRRYPHEASGGEKQRVVIATAFACQPECIIFDEPTTALDVITARQILDLFAELQAETGVASLYISHDLALVSQRRRQGRCDPSRQDRRAGSVGDVFARPQDGYTQKLLAAVPRPDHRLIDTEALKAGKPLVEVEKAQRALRPHALPRQPARAPRTRSSPAIARSASPSSRARSWASWARSGSGKSTLAKALTGLNRFEGAVRFDRRRSPAVGDMDRAYRRDVQIIFQHPDSSLNPRQRIREILSRPLDTLRRARARRDAARIGDCSNRCACRAAYAERYPHQLSGGEKQRVAIARAFASPAASW